MPNDMIRLSPPKTFKQIGQTIKRSSNLIIHFNSTSIFKIHALVPDRADAASCAMSSILRGLCCSKTKEGSVVNLDSVELSRSSKKYLVLKCVAL